MKKCLTFLQKIKASADKEFLKYTGIFYLLMMIFFIYIIFGIGAESPQFTYAEF